MNTTNKRQRGRIPHMLGLVIATALVVEGIALVLTGIFPSPAEVEAGRTSNSLQLWVGGVMVVSGVLLGFFMIFLKRPTN